MTIDLSEGRTRDATRLAVQSAVAAAAQFLLMKTWGLPEQFVGILSAVMVVEPSIGSTLVAAQKRFVATIVGCGVGLACLLILPIGYGTAVALAVAMLFMNGLAGFYPRWRYGVVAAVALALGAETNAMQTATDRGIAIGLGVVIGMVSSLVIWPDKSSMRAGRHLKDALRALVDYLNESVEASLSDDQELSGEKARGRYAKEISLARNAAKDVRIADNSNLKDRIQHTEHLYHAVVILERIAGETNSVQGDEAHQAKMISSIREIVCAMVNELAENDSVPSNMLDDLRTMLDDYRDSVQAPSSEGRSQILKHAMLFGLSEIEDSLTGFANLTSST